jgi:TRAP-type C4-dicarboxylate transport system permease large subunit
MFGLSSAAVKDLAERAGRTFAQTFLALYAPVVLGAGSLGGLLSVSTADKAATAGIAAVFSLVMGYVGVRAGSTKDNGSVL